MSSRTQRAATGSCARLVRCAAFRVGLGHPRRSSNDRVLPSGRVELTASPRGGARCSAPRLPWNGRRPHPPVLSSSKPAADRRTTLPQPARHGSPARRTRVRTKAAQRQPAVARLRRRPGLPRGGDALVRSTNATAVRVTGRFELRRPDRASTRCGDRQRRRSVWCQLTSIDPQNVKAPGEAVASRQKQGSISRRRGSSRDATDSSDAGGDVGRAQLAGTGGPGGALGGKELHPVAHVSYEDALAYAAWAGKQPPTKIECEYPSRTGGPPTKSAWEDDFIPRGKRMANTGAASRSGVHRPGWSAAVSMAADPLRPAEAYEPELSLRTVDDADGGCASGQRRTRWVRR